MIMREVATPNPPIHENLLPSVAENAPIGPRLVSRPNPNSAFSKGRDHNTMNNIHAIKNDPPPLCVATRGNRQRLPVPTAMPSPTAIMAHLDENLSFGFTLLFSP